MFSKLNNKYKISIFVSAFLLSWFLLVPQSAAASPITKQQQEVQSIQSQVNTLDDQVEITTEEYNEAQIKLQQINQEIDTTRNAIIEQSKLIDQLENSLSIRAQSLYRGGHFSYVDVLFSAKTFEDFFTVWDMVDKINVKDAADINALEQAREAAWAKEEELILQKAEAKKVSEDIALKIKAIEEQLSRREKMLAGAQQELGELQEQIQIHYTPPTNKAQGGIVNIAKQYLGAPYRWGAAGPNSFDCSGFTMYVYQKAGISLPHSSRAQSSRGKKVSRNNLQPGDLVFFGRPIHHVGIYVGDGMMIHSPHTGARVRIDPLRSNMSTAVRL